MFLFCSAEKAGRNFARGGKIPSRALPARELAASPQKVSRAHPLPPATQANYRPIKSVTKMLFKPEELKNAGVAFSC